MNTPSLTDLDLDTLSAADQRELFNRLSARFDRAPTKIKEDLEIFEIIKELLVDRGVSCPPADVFLKSFTHQRYAQIVEQINATISRGIGRLLRRPQRRNLLRICLGSLIALRVEWDHTITMTQVLSSAPSLLTTAIERDFPGYIAAKMLDRVAGLG